MWHALLRDTRFFALLTTLDQDLAEQTRIVDEFSHRGMTGLDDVDVEAWAHQPIAEQT